LGTPLCKQWLANSPESRLTGVYSPTAKALPSAGPEHANKKPLKQYQKYLTFYQFNPVLIDQ